MLVQFINGIITVWSIVFILGFFLALEEQSNF